MRRDGRRRAHACRTGRSRTRRAFTASRWSSLAVAARAGWRASDLELRDESQSYTAATLAEVPRARLQAPPSSTSSSAPTRSPISRPGWNYPAILDAAHFAVISRPGHPVDDTPAPAAATWRDRMVRPPLDAISHIDPMIVLIDAPTADVSSSAIRRAARARRIDRRRSCPDPVRQHIEQHGLYSPASPGRRAQRSRLRASRQARLHGQD